MSTTTSRGSSSSSSPQPVGDAMAFENVTRRVLSANNLKAAQLEPFLSSIPDGTPHVALSAAYTPERKLEWLAFLHAGQQALLVHISPSKLTPKQEKDFRQNLAQFIEALLEENIAGFIAYDADVLAAALFLDCGIRFQQCHDIQSLPPPASFHKFGYSKSLFDRKGAIFTQSTYATLFDNSSKAPNCQDNLVGRAWGALNIGARESKAIRGSIPLDTTYLPNEILNLAARTIREMDQLDAIKPTSQKHDITSASINRKGDLEVIGARFKTRVRMHEAHQVSQISLKGNQNLAGTTKSVKGKTSTFKMPGVNAKQSLLAGTIESITTIGKEASTTSESQLRDMLHSVLTGNSGLLATNPIICDLYGFGSPRRESLQPLKDTGSHKITSTLNKAQRKAVHGFCLASTEGGPVVKLVHGPPGTGKTTLISSIVQWMAGPSDAIYIVAQSNVAIKNVAEKLAKVGFFDFKLIVSEEFYFDWHEHLYEGVRRNLIRLPEMPDHAHAVDRELQGSRVILCTLSMLPNPKLAECGLTNILLPPTVLIVDEASQIALSNYWPTFHRFSKSLKKMCFVGDHKQLAPYGERDVKTLESIFERKQLVKQAYFLNTQYRMPHPIGNFISKNVYDGKLLTEHAISSDNCLQFVDVNGQESKLGHSTKNEREARCCVRIAKQLGTKNWRILTAYDAQRQLIENMLKREKVPWEDRVFNVDSFQGNEADYIIVSLVRTLLPGFLKDKRRTNVMLSRCKKGMVIVANRKFLLGNSKAKKTLVATMVAGIPNSSYKLTERDIMNDHKVFA